ncbi:MAG TPA: hypothetical protein PLM98_14245, partial [Thiolinea sp.]|nr:hypothetical protein [Thiolinea sp.]
AQAKYNQANAELEDIDGCILKIATNMGHDSAETTESSNLRARIQQLHDEIDGVDKKISETNRQCLPFEFTGLVNERAQFTPAISNWRFCT